LRQAGDNPPQADLISVLAGPDMRRKKEIPPQISAGRRQFGDSPWRKIQRTSLAGAVMQQIMDRTMGKTLGMPQKADPIGVTPIREPPPLRIG
jgi:hypothetical protein